MSTATLARSAPTTDVERVVIPAPELRGAILELAACEDFEVGIDGPAGTGKTFAILYFIHILLLRYPGAKIFVCRKYNTDLAGSAMATFRESVLDVNEGVVYFGGNKIKPAAFLYPNGSELIVNGLDKPGKVKSMDFDLIYINEATECSLDDIEFCRMRLARRKKSTLPKRYHKLIMDFNPDAPGHFLNQRMNDGVTRRILSRHEDNPFLWDSKTQDWTPEGYNYIFVVLAGLTGVRLARFRYGLWAAAEGTVYEDSWDRKRNVVAPFEIPRSWPRYLAIDFGYTNPFVCLWAAIDPDGRIIIYRQIYMTKKLVEDHAKDIAIASGWFQLLPPKHPRYAPRAAEWADPLPREVITDHDAEDAATLSTHLRLSTTKARKSVSEGIQAMAGRLRPAGDGKPRLMIFANCLVERDEELAKQKKPVCLEDEPEVYVWKKGADASAKDEPVKANDHALDPCRYLCLQFVSNVGVTYFKDIWK
jgi:PBSX family phage terminase large subunit